MSTGTEESELEPRKSLGDAVLDPHISAMQAKPARKSRLSMASAHTGHGQQVSSVCRMVPASIVDPLVPGHAGGCHPGQRRWRRQLRWELAESVGERPHVPPWLQTSSEEEGEEDGSEWQGQRAEAGLTATRAALEKLADDPVLGRVARDEKLAAEVEMTRELAGAIDAMDLSGEGLKRGNSYTGGEMRRIVSRHLNREHRRRKSAEGNRSNTMRSGASHSIGESLAQGTQRDEGTVTDATERKKVGVGVQFASVMHVGKTFLHSMSFGKTASEGVVEQSRIPTGGSNMLPPHRVAGPNRALGAQSPAEKTSTDASRAVSRMSSVNTRQAANVLRQVSVYLQRPSQKYIARSSQVGHALQDRTMERATSRSRPPPVIPRAASMRARLHGDAWGSSSGPGRADPRLRAIARMDSRIAAGRIYERVDSDKPDVAVETVEEACPVSEQPPESPDAAQGASEVCGWQRHDARGAALRGLAAW